MIVVCTGCSAKFKVADEKVGPKGAKLRCSKCQNVFTVRREEPAASRLEPAGRGPPEGPPPLPPAKRGRPAEPRPAASHPAAPRDRSAFEIDLEPAAPRSTAPDPFAPLSPPDDPFAVQFSEAAMPAPAPAPPPATLSPQDPFGGPGPDEDDAFAAVQAPIPPELLHTPAPMPAPPAQPVPSYVGHAGDDPFGTLPPLGGAPPPFDADLALEDRITPRPRPARPQSSVPPDDPFAGVAADPGHDRLDGGHPGDIPPLSAAFPGEPFVGFTGAFSTSAPLEAPEPPGPAVHAPHHEPPLREDPFAAAAVDADPLKIAPGPPPAMSVALPPSDLPDRVAPRRGPLRAAAVNAISLAVLLAVSLALLLVWRGGLPLADALHPTELLAALGNRGRGTGLLDTRQVTSGLYERQQGAPLLFVRGAVVSRASGPVAAVRVSVDVVRGGAVVAHGEVRAGAVLTPEELHQAADAATLARLAQAASARAPAQVGPGESVPFLVAFVDYPSELSGLTLRVTASSESGP